MNLQFMLSRNAFAMALNLECLGSKSATSLGITGGIPWCETEPILDAWSSGTTWPLVRVREHVFWGLSHYCRPPCSAEPLVQVLEHVFVVVFGLELVYRLYCVRCEYFRDYWNWLDATLVLIAVADLYLLDPLLSETPAHNATTLRVFRVVKLASRPAKHHGHFHDCTSCRHASLGRISYVWLRLELFASFEHSVFFEARREFCESGGLETALGPCSAMLGKVCECLCTPAASWCERHAESLESSVDFFSQFPFHFPFFSI